MQELLVKLFCPFIYSELIKPFFKIKYDNVMRHEIENIMKSLNHLIPVVMMGCLLKF